MARNAWARGVLSLVAFGGLLLCAVPVLPTLLQNSRVLPPVMAGVPSWVLGSLAGCFGLACWTNWVLGRRLPTGTDPSSDGPPDRGQET